MKRGLVDAVLFVGNAELFDTFVPSSTTLPRIVISAKKPEKFGRLNEKTSLSNSRSRKRRAGDRFAQRWCADSVAAKVSRKASGYGVDPERVAQNNSKQGVKNFRIHDSAHQNHRRENLRSDQSRERRARDLWIRGSVICDPPASSEKPTRTIDAGGYIIFPGGIDMHSRRRGQESTPAARATGAAPAMGEHSSRIELPVKTFHRSLPVRSVLFRQHSQPVTNMLGARLYNRVRCGRCPAPFTRRPSRHAGNSLRAVRLLLLVGNDRRLLN